MAHIINPSEFAARQAPLAKRIFTGSPFFEICNLATCPVFVNAAWTPIVLPFDLRFDLSEDTGNASKYGYLLNDEYTGFFATLNRRGVDEITLTMSLNLIDPVGPNIACRADRQGISDAESLGLRLLPVTLYAFDETATWGLCSNGEYDGYSLVAGTDAFMADLITSYGGLARIKRRFWDFNTKFHNWPVDDDQRWCKDWKALGWGEVPKQ